MKKVIYIFALVMVTFVSCDKSEIPNQLEITEQNSKIIDSEMIKLGKKRENPYSVENILKAYQTLRNEGKLLAPINIQATNLYVRFLPKTEDEYQTLKSQGYELFDYPLEYERIEGGSYYHDPSLPKDGFTWIYVVLPIDYQFGAIKYEIISQLVLQDESAPSNVSAQKVKAIDSNYWVLIEEKSHELTNNQYYHKSSNPSGMQKISLRPSGKITMYDEVLGREIGVSGIKVRASRWFTAKVGYTVADGSYIFDYTFSGPVDYSIVWERENWDIRNGNWDQATYNGPNTISTGWSVRISSGDKQYVYANVHRACETYWYNISPFGIKTPPLDSFWHPRVKLGVYDTAGRGFSSPLSSWLTLPSVYIYSYSENPDGSSTRNTSAYIYQTSLHELAHTSHWEMDQDGFWSINDKVVEGWAVGVAYEISKAIYPVSTLKNEDWQYITKTDIVNLLENKYTPIVIDLMDTNNQYDFYDPNQYANDNVSNYSLAQIEGALRGAKTLEQWRDNLKNLYNNPTESNLDELFNFYINI